MVSEDLRPSQQEDMAEFTAVSSSPGGPEPGIRSDIRGAFSAYFDQPDPTF